MIGRSAPVVAVRMAYPSLRDSAPLGLLTTICTRRAAISSTIELVMPSVLAPSARSVILRTASASMPCRRSTSAVPVVA